MSIKPKRENHVASRIPAQQRPETEFARPLRVGYGARSLAVLRIVMGLVFLWPFADKLFGLGYSTPSAGAWIRGGSPTRGFLSTVDVGPFASMFHAWAGTWWADWLFMLSLLGVGVAVIAGAGLRIAAVAGTVLMLLMWAAEWPPARTTGAGTATHSSNPIFDYHLVFALVLIGLAAAFAGDTWGLGRRWAALIGTRTWLR
ncbi:DoxX family membrane protein [Amycolatopsis benzoatilytica]|uniref:DoxX family membrane protein n=1 Tax=Amycolatopsis benzoatilytica TaxID=346045 RepID=UPI000365EEFB|nr:DoxX family membrane protein [Amycolatopsis benzoatilytica]